MNRRLTGPALGLALLLCASAAQAAPGFVQMTLQDGHGLLRNYWVWSSDGTLGGNLSQTIQLVDSTQTAVMGEVTASPTANTVLDRLKTVHTDLGTVHADLAPLTTLNTSFGAPSDVPCTPGSACSAEANFRLMTSQLDTALTKLAAAISDLDAIKTAAQDSSPTLVNDPNNAPFAGVIDMPTDAAPYTAGRSFLANCTAAGNIKLTFSDSSTRIVPVSIGLNVLPFSVTAWTLTGAGSPVPACANANLK